MKFYEVSKRDMFYWFEYIELHAGKKQKKSARTINKYLAAIGSFYDYFEGMGGYIENPVRVIQSSTQSYWKTFNVTKDQVGVNFFRKKETEKKNTKRLFQDEVDSLYRGMAELSIDESVTIRNKSLFRVLYETGSRISAVLGLRISDFSEDR